MNDASPHLGTTRHLAATSASRLIPLHISERKLLLWLLDLLAVNGALAVVVWLRLGQPLSWRVLVRHPLWFTLLASLWALFAVSLDAYDLCAASDPRSSLWPVTKAAFLTWGVYLLIPYVTPALLGSQSTVVLFLFLMVVLLALERGLYAVVLKQPVFQRRALVIGAGWAGRAIVQALSEDGDGSLRVAGFVDDDPEKMGRIVEVGEWKVEGGRGKGEEGEGIGDGGEGTGEQGARLHVLGDRHALPGLVARHGITTLILAITDDANGELLQILMDCPQAGVEVIPMSVLYEQLTGRVPVEHLGDHWNVSMATHHPGTRTLSSVLKRVMDIVLAGLGLLILGLAFPFIAAAIYFDCPGPILYTQKRVGKGCRVFRLYKFRSMVPNAENGGAVWAEQNDSRVTRVGRVLRKTHVDEFPQFVNILKGEMSAVGPRPERPEFVEELAKEIPFYRVRHAVKPGMAGWGLIKQGYGSSKEDALLKLQYDLYYIKHQSLWLDVVILLRTIVDTLTLGGR